MNSLDLYRRHVDGGETIRALAREHDVHASTILRRIRKVEDRRSEPLIDAGIDNEAVDPTPLLKRLADSATQLLVTMNLPSCVVVRHGVEIGRFDRSMAEQAALNGKLVLVAEGRVRVYIRKREAGRRDADPLDDLKRRRILDDGQLKAAVKVRSEFERTGGATALDALGPDLGDIVRLVCCERALLEAAERQLGWAARSGKVVLRIALDRLARHYEAEPAGGRQR